MRDTVKAHGVDIELTRRRRRLPMELKCTGLRANSRR